MADGLGGRRPGKAVGEDLRRRAVAAVLERGMSYRAAALKFEVCATSVLRWVRRFEERGDVRADPPRGRRSRIEEERARVFRILKRRPAITVPALRQALAARGLTVGDAAVKRFLKRHGLQRRQRLAGRAPASSFAYAAPAGEGGAQEEVSQ